MTTIFPTTRLTTLKGHNGPVHALSYSSGSAQYILTGCSDRLIRLYNPSRVDSKSSGLIQTYQQHGYEVLDLVISEDNARFVSVGGDKTVFLWDVATGQTLRRFGGHAGRVECCAFAAQDDSVVVSGSFDSTVKLWDTKSNAHKPLMTLSEARDSVSSLSVHGHDILTGSIDGKLRTYDIRMGQLSVDVLGHAITSVAVTKFGDSVLVSNLDSTLRLMDRANGKLLNAFRDKGEEGSEDGGFVSCEYRIRSALGMNDSVVVSGGEDGRVFVWDLVSGKVVQRLWHDEEAKAKGQGTGGTGVAKGKKAVVSAVAFCRARKEWCSAGGNGEVVVWGMGEDR